MSQERNITNPKEKALQEKATKSLRDKHNREEKEKLRKEKRRQQTAPARKKRAENREKRANEEPRRQLAQAEARLIAEKKEHIKALRQSITEETIREAMRPLRRYNAKSKSYSKAPDKCMHTLKSAELAILKEGYTPELAILSLPKKGWKGPPIWGVNDSKLEPCYTDPSQASNPRAWKSWVFFNGYRYESFPVPPPPTDDAPIIEDEKWEDLLLQSRAYSWVTDTEIAKLSDLLPLSPLDGGIPSRAFAENSLFLQAVGGREARLRLVAELKKLGLLQYDGHYDGLSAIYNERESKIWEIDLDDASTDTYQDEPEKLVKEDPRCLWRDLHHTLNSPEESDQIRSQIQELAYHAFQAGMEHQKYVMLRDRQDDIRDAYEFNKKKKRGGLRKESTETYAEITAAYYKSKKNQIKQSSNLDIETDSDFFPNTASDLIKFISESDNSSWKKLINVKHPKDKKNKKPSPPRDPENKNRKLKEWIRREKKFYWKHVRELLR